MALAVSNLGHRKLSKVDFLPGLRQDGISFQELVYNLRSYPLNRDNFIEFLRNEHCEENFLFYLDVEAYAQHVMKRTKDAAGNDLPILDRPAAAANLSDNDWAHLIVINWIGPSAKLGTLNISADLIGSLLASSNVNWSDLETAQIDARKMIFLQDRLERFFIWATEHNISLSESEFRTRTGIVTTFVSIAVALLLRFFAPIPPGGVFGLTLSPVFTGVYFFLSGRAKTCMGRSLKGNLMPDEVTWWQARDLTGTLRDWLRPNAYDGEACDVAIKDEFARRKLRRLGFYLFFRCLFVASAICAIIAWA